MSEFTAESVGAQRDNALLGRFAKIVGDGSLTDLTDLTPLAGKTLSQGTYLYRIPVAGNGKVIVTLKPSTVTGSPTAEVYTPYADGTTENPAIAATSISLAEDTQTDDAIDVTGERVKVLKIVVGAGEQLVFDVAEYKSYNAQSGGGGGGGAVTVANGANVVEGSTTDAAVTTNANGTLSAKLRGLVAIFADVWNGTLHALGINTTHIGGTAVATGTGNANGGTQRVVIATDQPAFAVTVSDGSGPLTVDGTVTITDGSGPVTVDGTVTPGASENHIGEVAPNLAVVSANFSRPADTTQYAANDLVANNTTAGSVTPLSWTTAARIAAGAFKVRRARLFKTSASQTAAKFRLHLYAASPTVANGDNGAWSSNRSSYVGSIDFDLTTGNANARTFTDPAAWVATSRGFGSDIVVKLASGQTLYGLLQALDTYTPANAETFTIELELERA